MQFLLSLTYSFQSKLCFPKLFRPIQFFSSTVFSDVMSWLVQSHIYTVYKMDLGSVLTNFLAYTAQIGPLCLFPSFQLRSLSWQKTVAEMEAIICPVPSLHSFQSLHKLHFSSFPVLRSGVAISSHGFGDYYSVTLSGLFSLFFLFTSGVYILFPQVIIHPCRDLITSLT